MVVGGLAGVLVTASLPTTMAPALIVLAAVVAAAVCGMLYSLLLAFASINLKADQTIGGTALNMLATAIAMILAKHFNGSTSAKISYTNKPFLFSIGGLDAGRIRKPQTQPKAGTSGRINPANVKKQPDAFKL